MVAAGFFLAFAPYDGVGAVPQVAISRKVDVENNGVVSKNLDIQIPFGKITYKGRSLGVEGEDIEDLQFGLNFHRPPRTNGGWDSWNFLKVGVDRDSHSTQVFKKYLLDDVHVLESGRRLMLQFVWRSADSSPVFTVTALQYPTHPDWIFLKVKTEGGLDTLDTIDLSCFPGNTAGPPERERWLATLTSSYRLSSQKMTVEPPYSAFIFFNMLAQQNSGCLLVTDPQTVSTVSIAAGSAIQTRFQFLPDQTEATFALGAYDEKSTEDIIRVFRMEGAAVIGDFLKRIDWAPNLDIAANKLLLDTLNDLVADQSADVLAQFQGLERKYDELKNAGRTAEALEVVHQLVEMKDKLIEEALSKWK